MSEAADSSMEKPLAEKVQEQGCVFRDIVTTQSTFTDLKTHMYFGYVFTIPTSGNIFMWFGQCTGLLLQPSIIEMCFTIAHQLMHGRLESQCGLRPVIQISMPVKWNIYRDCQREK